MKTFVLAYISLTTEKDIVLVKVNRSSVFALTLVILVRRGVISGFSSSDDGKNYIIPIKLESVAACDNSHITISYDE